MSEKPSKYRTEIQQMMFVSGETGEATAETTTLIEGIVQQQVIEMLTRATALAARRGVRAINTDDLIFLIRHDRAKVSRLRTFLSWKDVRKSAKDSDDKGGGGGGAEQLDDFDIGGPGAPDLSGAPGGGPQGQRGAAPAPKGNKKAKVGLPWDVASYYSEQAPEREDEDDEEEDEMNAATLARLKSADERTKHMTPEEYLHWSECRQASFTFRKGKRFREWAGFGVVTEAKPNDDIVDILGFLTFEIVQTLTEEALRVKAAEDMIKRGRGGADGGDGDGDGEPTAGRKRKRREPGLFDPPEEARTPVGPKHIIEAFRRLQKPDQKMRYMSHISGSSRRRTTLRLI
ncbi:TFIID-18kDa-domain-containing protein [Myriangium duriaei CBS 260.36]|uniref:TFIID-18kDa-domain-containing protein n=1 Tax=Myriangium duriaei CBS 260.36 TaxID=1168546 RepID=A0A9P4JF96_9PEZI|nr:TFIID-18kDa-domain-containing protein [Myriangium duriaei CBS 260.36]